MSNFVRSESARVNNKPLIHYYLSVEIPPKRFTMNSKFDFDYPRQPWDGAEPGNEDLLFDEKFELLSAYIDGEVSPQERKQVQGWIDSDPEFKQTYLGLIRLQNALPQVPVPPAIDTDALAQKVFARLEQENRWRGIWFWGSVTAAAVVVAAYSSILGKPLDPSLNQANLDPAIVAMDEDPLMIAIHEPMFEVLTKVDPGHGTQNEGAEQGVD
ncbi:anti-sigma factor [Synechocystis salina LEGE 00031]|uniref:Anti-sigma factor n=2 Tax=Synechocystis TaxID=1142 RepID=A0ABR9VLP9_9SYNC|nr:anti-sigma factor [Synechocystis salina LEGE 00041]MBE9252272.1 anti-sigma factor [Synechocystis salina LEGE 00031]